MKKILITGASGYVGKAFLKAYGREYNFRVFGRTPVEGSFEFVQGDIRNVKDVLKVTQDVEIIIHLAAITTDSKNVKDIDFFEINVLGTFNVLEAAVKNKVSNVVYSSSVCAVGFRSTPKLIMETDRCIPSDGMYGYSKYLSERLCEYYAEKHGINVICLRTAMVVPQHKLVIPSNPFASRWLGAVHIEDVVEAFRLAIENENVCFDIFHIAADSPYSKFDITKAKNILGYKPKQNFGEVARPGTIGKAKALIRTALGLPHRAKDILTALISGRKQ